MQDISQSADNNALNKEDMQTPIANEEIKPELAALNESLSYINKAESQHSLSLEKNSDFLHENRLTKESAAIESNHPKVDNQTTSPHQENRDEPAKFNFEEFMSSQDNFEESFLNTLFKLKYGELATKQVNEGEKIKSLNLDSKSITSPNEYYYVNSEDSKNYIRDFLVKYNKIEMENQAGNCKFSKLKNHVDFDKNKRKNHLLNYPKIISSQMTEQERKTRLGIIEKKQFINRPKYPVTVSKLAYKSPGSKVNGLKHERPKKVEKIKDLGLENWRKKPRSFSSTQVRSGIFKSTSTLVKQDKRNRSVAGHLSKSKPLSSRSNKKKVETVVIDLFAPEGGIPTVNSNEGSTTTKGANELELHNFHSNSIGEVYNNTQYTITSNRELDKDRKKIRDKLIPHKMEGKGNLRNYRSKSKMKDGRTSKYKCNSSGKNYLKEANKLASQKATLNNSVKLRNYSYLEGFKRNYKAKSQACINTYLKSQINTIYYSELKHKNNFFQSLSLSPQSTVKDSMKSDVHKVYASTYKDKFNSIKAKLFSYSDILKNFCTSNKNLFKNGNKLKHQSLTETSLIRAAPRIRPFSPLDKTAVSYQIKKYYNKNILKDINPIFHLRAAKSPLPFKFGPRSSSVIRKKKEISRSLDRKSGTQP